MKKTLLSLGMAAVLGLTGMSASASMINVGGVTWDPDAVFGFPTLNDFSANASLIESAVAQLPGDLVTGRGKFDKLNSATSNGSSFCNGCELTYTFSMNLAGITPTGATTANFVFNNLSVKFFVDTAQNYNGTMSSASDGELWLEMSGNGVLDGSGNNIGTGSDTGSGSALLDVIGGLAYGNFNTNTFLNGADMVFSSSFQPTGAIDPETGRAILFGTSDLQASSIPEPESLALVGLGLLGLAAARRRKQA